MTDIALPLVQHLPSRRSGRRKPRPQGHSTKHRDLLDGEFWRHIPAYRDVDRATFLDHRWQAKRSVTNVRKLREAVEGLVSRDFFTEVERSLERVPMSMRISPYLISLIDWDRPEIDPIRRQFVPMARELRPDHPLVGLDSLAEKADSPVPGLTHRYPDKALFLALDTCPVYCRYCTRSYAVGLETDTVSKVQLSPRSERWEAVFDYIRTQPQLEDVVVSGGDAYQLKADHIRTIGETLLGIEHVCRIRFATKGIAVAPMKILTDEEWTNALVDVAQLGRSRGREVMIHTHFDHPRGITEITQQATARLFDEGVTVRSQCVLLRGVNDDPALMRLLMRRMSYINVHPYYVYQHDFVRGVEDLRTRLEDALEIEKQVRGATAGYNTPTFVVDTPGGGGKRDAHSFEHYDRTTGVSVYRSPNCDPDALYYYFDPVHLLPAEGQARWRDPAQHRLMVREAAIAAGGDPDTLRLAEPN